MLSDLPETEHKKALADAGLNVPFGAWCFLTSTRQRGGKCTCRNNPPFGARRFLTPMGHPEGVARRTVLIHLMALGAF